VDSLDRAIGHKPFIRLSGNCDQHSFLYSDYLRGDKGNRLHRRHCDRWRVHYHGHLPRYVWNNVHVVFWVYLWHIFFEFSFCTTLPVICRGWDFDSIRGRVSIDTLERYPRTIPSIDSQSTFHWHRLTLDRHLIGRESIESGLILIFKHSYFRSVYMRRKILGRLLTNCWSTVIKCRSSECPPNIDGDVDRVLTEMSIQGIHQHSTAHALRIHFSCLLLTFFYFRMHGKREQIVYLLEAKYIWLIETMSTAWFIPACEIIQLQYGSNLLVYVTSSLPNDLLTFSVHPKIKKSYQLTAEMCP